MPRRRLAQRQMDYPAREAVNRRAEHARIRPPLEKAHLLSWFVVAERFRQRVLIL